MRIGRIEVSLRNSLKYGRLMNRSNPPAYSGSLSLTVSYALLANTLSRFVNKSRSHFRSESPRSALSLDEALISEPLILKLNRRITKIEYKDKQRKKSVPDLEQFEHQTNHRD